MKKDVSWSVGAVAGLLIMVPFVGVLADGIPTGSGGTGNQPAIVPGGGAGGTGLQEEKGEHPKIARAIRDLHEAIAYMKRAPHDFDGHREAAVEASEAAVKQLRLALEYRENKVGVPSAGMAGNANEMPTVAGSLTNSPAYREEKSEHPRIARAIRSLHEAVAHMKKAPHDFGGHREAAMQASETAITQLQLALEYRESRESSRTAPSPKKQ